MEGVNKGSGGGCSPLQDLKEGWSDRRNRTNGALHFHSALHTQESYGMYAVTHNTLVSQQELIMYHEPSATLAPQASI